MPAECLLHAWIGALRPVALRTSEKGDGGVPEAGERGLLISESVLEQLFFEGGLGIQV